MTKKPIINAAQMPHPVMAIAVSRVALTVKVLAKSVKNRTTPQSKRIPAKASIEAPQDRL